MTEIRPGIWQAKLPNGVICTFPSPNRQAAEQYVADQLKRLMRRRERGIGDKIFQAPVSYMKPKI